MTKIAADVIATLRNEHLVRTSMLGDQEALETYHDRIRDSVVSSLAPEDVARLHLKIARELEATGRADPEALAQHYGAAGQRERAAHFAADGAARAADALAFQRAAKLFKRALELTAETPENAAQRRRLKVALAESLANAGRGAEAKEVMPIRCGSCAFSASALAWPTSFTTALRFFGPEVARKAASAARELQTRAGSPARSASSRCRAWNEAPRITSTIESPIATDQQTSMRESSSGEICDSCRELKVVPRSQSRARR